MATVYYLQDNQHVFAVEHPEKPGYARRAKRIGMIAPKRGKPPAFNKSKAVEIPAEKALKYVKVSGVKSPSKANGEPVKPVISSAVLDMRPKVIPVSPVQMEINRSKVFMEIVDFQKKSQELHSRVLGLVKSGLELKTLPENITEVLKALYMGGNIEIKDPPKEPEELSKDVKQFDGDGILTLPAPEKKDVKPVLRGKLY